MKKHRKNKKFIKEIDQHEQISNKNKKACISLTYIKHFLIVVFADSISAFGSLVNIPLKIMSSSIG